jgi:hypothetical protein
MDKRNADICVSLARRSEHVDFPELHLNQQRNKYDYQLPIANGEHFSNKRKRSSVSRLGCKSKRSKHSIKSERYDVSTIGNGWFGMANKA